MLWRNIKQSLTALEVFNILEKKVYSKEFNINSIYSEENVNRNEGYITIFIKYTDDSSIQVNLYNDYDLTIAARGVLPKNYNQKLTNEEFENVKKRFIKLAQKQQDDFENWIKDTDDNNEIDAE